MSAGDILFYRASGHSLIEWFITLRTGQPYVHCGVDMGDGLEVQALSGGVVRTPLAAVPPADVYPTAHYVNSQRLAPALDWLVEQVGDAYGYLDIVDDALPSWWRVLLTGRRAYSCSHLAAQFLVEAGEGAMLGELAAQTETVTPNSLARACGLIK